MRLSFEFRESGDGFFVVGDKFQESIEFPYGTFGHLQFYEEIDEHHANLCIFGVEFDGGLQFTPSGRRYSMTSVNGQTNSAVQLDFIVTPLRTGRHLIEPITGTVAAVAITPDSASSSRPHATTSSIRPASACSTATPRAG